MPNTHLTPHTVYTTPHPSNGMPNTPLTLQTVAQQTSVPELHSYKPQHIQLPPQTHASNHTPIIHFTPQMHPTHGNSRGVFSSALMALRTDRHGQLSLHAHKPNQYHFIFAQR